MTKIRSLSFLFFIAIQFLSSNIQAQKLDVELVLQDPDQRMALMEAISEDTDLAFEMMGYLMRNEVTLNFLCSDDRVVNQVMESNENENEKYKVSMDSSLIVPQQAAQPVKCQHKHKGEKGMCEKCKIKKSSKIDKNKN